MHIQFFMRETINALLLFACDEYSYELLSIWCGTII